MARVGVVSGSDEVGVDIAGAWSSCSMGSGPMAMSDTIPWHSVTVDRRRRRTVDPPPTTDPAQVTRTRTTADLRVGPERVGCRSLRHGLHHRTQPPLLRRRLRRPSAGAALRKREFHLGRSGRRLVQPWRWERSPWAPKTAISSTGPSIAPNQCGVFVLNSTASPGSTIRSCSPRIRRIRPSRTYIQS